MTRSPSIWTFFPLSLYSVPEECCLSTQDFWIPYKRHVCSSYTTQALHVFRVSISLFHFQFWPFNTYICDFGLSLGYIWPPISYTMCAGDAELASPGDVIKRLELKKYKWGRNLIKIELLLFFFHPIPFTTIHLMGFDENSYLLKDFNQISAPLIFLQF